MRNPDRIGEARGRFIELCARYDYRRAWRQLHREFDAPLLADMATEQRQKVEGSPHGQHLPDEGATAAARRWQPLFTNTAEAI